MRINKVLMKKQLITIIGTISILILETMFFNYLINNGMSCLFTCGGYKEAFNEITKADLMMINFIKYILGLGVVMCGYETMLSNKALEQLEKEEKMILEVIRNEG